MALASVGVNAGLSLTKLGLSVLSGSLALAADALHSFTEVVGSLGPVVKGRGPQSSWACPVMLVLEWLAHDGVLAPWRYR